jgi:hypothetical protein
LFTQIGSKPADKRCFDMPSAMTSSSSMMRTFGTSARIMTSGASVAGLLMVKNA